MAITPSEIRARQIPEEDAKFTALESMIDKELNQRWRPGREVAIYTGGHYLPDDVLDKIEDIYGEKWFIRQDDGPNKMLCFQERRPQSTRSETPSVNSRLAHFQTLYQGEERDRPVRLTRSGYRLNAAGDVVTGDDGMQTYVGKAGNSL